MDIDPSLAAMAARLAEIAIKNTGTAVYSRVQAIASQKADQQKVNELSTLIDTLIEENGELSRIANAFKQELVAQQISDKDITYIIDSVIPVLTKLVEQADESGNAEAAQKMEDALEILEPLFSIETLTVLQLVGFNFKKAIGEPLTLLVQKLITSRVPVNQQAILENNKLTAELDIQMLKIAQDEEASVRLKQLLAIWRGNNSNP